MKKLLTLISAALISGTSLAQTAKIQVIHNSADASASTVDVYLNGGLAIDDFAFRTATPFIDVPAGVQISVAIAPSTSASVSDAIATFNYTLTADEKYVIVANGIVSGTGYNPAIPFDLHVYAGGRESATNGTNTDLLVCHGSTDAPAVSVWETGVGAGQLFNNFVYSDFEGYLELPTNNYVIEVRDDAGTTTVASYDAPLATLGLQGASAVVVASGFLNPANNSNGADFGLWVALPSGGNLIPLPTSTAKIQVIHNSADAAASQVDVYLNGTLAIDNFAFRTATPFIDVPAGVQISVAIAPSTSTSVSDAIATFNYNLASGAKYVIVANGIVSGTGYNPAIPFDLHVYAGGRESATNGTNTDLLVCHGSTDAPAVSVWETGIGAGQLFNNFVYSDFEGYLELPTNDYVIEVRDDAGTITVASYDAPLATLGLQGASAVVVASGFLNPANNSNGAGFGLWVALPAGGNLIPLPSSTAKIQVIHNSADAAASTVDVYLNGGLAIDDFAFRTATPFIDVPAGVQISVAIAPSTSTSVSDAIATFNYSLASGEKYVIVANGIVSPSGYTPAIPFDLHVFAGGRESATNGTNTDLLVCHGSTDAPAVSVWETGVGAGQLFNNFVYSDFEGYLELPTNDYVVEVRDNAGTTTVASYDAPLATLGLQGASAVVVASGFLNPANNSNGAGFGLWVALPSGGNLIPLPSSTAKIQVIHNSADAAASTVDVYLNGGLAIDDFAFRTATPFIDVPAGVQISVAIAPSTSTSVSDAIATFNYSLASGEKYVIVANGIVSPSGYTPAIPFDLHVFAGGRESATNGTNTDLLVCHGSTDAPAVSVWETGVGAGQLFNNFVYSDFEGYLQLPTNDYVVEVRDNAGTTTVAAYSAPLSTLSLQGASAVVVASGFLNPTNNSNGAGFGLWVALPSGGNLIPLPQVTTGLNENNSIGQLNVFPNPAKDNANISISLKEKSDVVISIFNTAGSLVTRTNYSDLQIGNNVLNISTADLSSGLYKVMIQSNESVKTTSLVIED